MQASTTSNDSLSNYGLHAVADRSTGGNEGQEAVPENAGGISRSFKCIWRNPGEPHGRGQLWCHSSRRQGIVVHSWLDRGACVRVFRTLKPRNLPQRMASPGEGSQRRHDNSTGLPKAWLGTPASWTFELSVGGGGSRGLMGSTIINFDGTSA